MVLLSNTAEFCLSSVLNVIILLLFRDKVFIENQLYLKKNTLRVLSFCIRNGAQYVTRLQSVSFIVILVSRSQSPGSDCDSRTSIVARLSTTPLLLQIRLSGFLFSSLSTHSLRVCLSLSGSSFKSHYGTLIIDSFSVKHE